MSLRWKPHVTVAAVIEQEGRFLLVEEHTPEGLRLNNPAGHLDPGESPDQGCSREVLEETAYAFAPTALVGLYMSRQLRPRAQGPEDVTYLRFAYTGTLGAFDAQRPLDTGIVRTVWLSAEELRASRDLHRSPLVLQCMEDYLRGQRYPLGLIYADASLWTPNKSL
ncbi:NUDIX hydrolase [uncultured Rhodoferax sp.]|uniref:NUDIX hydrolase n=1 Tax=uncultured Rhodoferax sp. TaxID=223188 RepID=UPI0025DBD436|nr:NUDIX hydrolase [uncultured Rhodoferax sp.]